jgi:hypothetical protein
MQFSRIRFPLWRMMTVIAAVACFAASPVAFATEPSSAATVITGWATLYAAPLILIFARAVRFGRAAKIAATIIVCGLPMVGFFAFFHLLMGLLVALLVGWLALMAVALFPSPMGKLVDEMYAAAPVLGGEPELPPPRLQSQVVPAYENRDWDDLERPMDRFPVPAAVRRHVRRT